MGPAENRAFSRGPRFFGPIKWHEAPAEGHFGAQKIEGPSKRRDFLQGPILKPITGPILWFGRVNFIKQARFTAQEPWQFNATCSYNFRRVFFDFWSFWYPPPYIFYFCPVLYIWLFLEEDVGGGWVGSLQYIWFSFPEGTNHRPEFPGRLANRRKVSQCGSF